MADRREDTSPDQAEPISPDEAAQLLGVSEGTIRSRHAAGVLPALRTNPLMFSRRTVVQTKLLTRYQLLALKPAKAAGLTREDIEAVGRSRAERRDGTAWYAYDDVAPIAAEKARQKASGAVPAARTAAEHRARFADAIDDYVLRHHDPQELVAEFWDTRTCPDFVPFAGLHRFTYGRYFLAADVAGGAPERWTPVVRSAGLAEDDHGRAEPVELQPEFDEVEGWHRFGAEVTEHAEENARYRAAREAWERAWYTRRCRLRMLGVPVLLQPADPPLGLVERDRLLRQWRAERREIADLSDRIWDVADMPPVELPANVFWHRWGKAGVLDGAEATFVVRSAGWSVNEQGDLDHLPEDEQYRLEPGRHLPGERLPPEVEELQGEALEASAAWRREYERRSRRRAGE